MHAYKFVFALTACMILAFSTVAFAEKADEQSAAGEKNYLPTKTVFHLDVRALTVFDVTAYSLTRNEEPNDQKVIESTFGGLASGVGVKLGSLIKGHHDVGGHLLFSSATVRTYYNPEEEGADGIKTRTDSSTFRVAAYYNYNWHARGWVMPYVGPVAGFGGSYSRFRDLDDDDAEINSGIFTPFIGMEAGVKLFPMKNVAFDIAMTPTAGTTLEKTRYGDDRDDDDYVGISVNLALNAGICVFFN